MAEWLKALKGELVYTLWNRLKAHGGQLVFHEQMPGSTASKEFMEAYSKYANKITGEWASMLIDEAKIEELADAMNNDLFG